MTPRATPAVRAPRESVPPSGVSDPSRLVAPIVVVSQLGEHELSHGTLTIGRLATVNLALSDALVSRMHARILVLPDRSVSIEDLHSTNGVFLNGVRLGRNAQQLADGDRLVIGTSELSVFNIHSCATGPRRVPRPSFGNAAASSETEPPSTNRGDALEVIGRFAERLASAGDYDQAASLLSGHLNKVLLGASAGLAVPETLIDEACRYALSLFQWTHKSAWIDYVIELHLTMQRLPTERTLLSLEASLGRPGTSHDRELYAYFLESLEPRRRRMTLNEQARLLRLRRLLN